MNTKDLTRREIDKQSFPLPLLKERGAESPIIGVSDGVRLNTGTRMTRVGWMNTDYFCYAEIK
jgi:hypothetical protein